MTGGEPLIMKSSVEEEIKLITGLQNLEKLSQTVTRHQMVVEVLEKEAGRLIMKLRYFTYYSYYIYLINFNYQFC